MLFSLNVWKKVCNVSLLFSIVAAKCHTISFNMLQLLLNADRNQSVHGLRVQYCTTVSPLTEKCKSASYLETLKWIFDIFHLIRSHCIPLSF